jgi:hypothetical protein
MQRNNACRSYLVARFEFGALLLRLCGYVWALSGVFVGFRFAAVDTDWRSKQSSTVCALIR